MNEQFTPTKAQLNLHEQLSTAIETLLHDLDIDADLVPGHRLYHAEILEPSENVSIILVGALYTITKTVLRYSLEQKMYVQFQTGTRKRPTVQRVEGVVVPFQSLYLKCVRI